MAIENYELTKEQAGRIPLFYFPGCEEEFVNGLEFKSRDDERPNPTILYRVKGYADSLCKLTLHPAMPIVQFVDFTGKNEDMDNIRSVVEGALEIKLKQLSRA